MIQEMIKAFLLIFIAEMGDKTQILAMAFATRFPVKKVLLGIFLGAFLNHGLAVILGSYISNFVPISTIQIIAGFAFIGFALWTLKGEAEEEEKEGQKSNFGPVVTVAIAFFIGELGDKTQLTAITLATDAVYPLFILCGTVMGMIVTGGIGIFVGKKLGDKIPEFTIKIIAAAVFMFFGVTKLFQSLPSKFLSWQYILVFTVVSVLSVFALLRPTLIKRNLDRKSALSKQENLDILKRTLELIKDNPDSPEYYSIHKTRKSSELALFGHSIEKISDWDEYKKSLTEIDKDIAITVFDDIQ